MNGVSSQVISPDPSQVIALSPDPDIIGTSKSDMKKSAAQSVPTLLKKSATLSF